MVCVFDFLLSVTRICNRCGGAVGTAMAAMQAKRMQAQRTAQRLNTRKEERAKALHER
tara:strand:- start:238 stop:411 length:174 start_codon:yes stop_codon:yes gene_type:complete